MGFLTANTIEGSIEQISGLKSGETEQAQSGYLQYSELSLEALRNYEALLDSPYYGPPLQVLLDNEIEMMGVGSLNRFMRNHSLDDIDVNKECRGLEDHATISDLLNPISETRFDKPNLPDLDLLIDAHFTPELTYLILTQLEAALPAGFLLSNQTDRPYAPKIVGYFEGRRIFEILSGPAVAETLRGYTKSIFKDRVKSEGGAERKNSAQVSEGEPLNPSSANSEEDSSKYPHPILDPTLDWKSVYLMAYQLNIESVATLFTEGGISEISINGVEQSGVSWNPYSIFTPLNLLKIIKNARSKKDLEQAISFFGVMERTPFRILKLSEVDGVTKEELDQLTNLERDTVEEIGKLIARLRFPDKSLHNGFNRSFKLESFKSIVNVIQVSRELLEHKINNSMIEKLDRLRAKNFHNIVTYLSRVPKENVSHIPYFLSRSQFLLSLFQTGAKVQFEELEENILKSGSSGRIYNLEGYGPLNQIADTKNQLDDLAILHIEDEVKTHMLITEILSQIYPFTMEEALAVYIAVAHPTIQFSQFNKFFNPILYTSSPEASSLNNMYTSGHNQIESPGFNTNMENRNRFDYQLDPYRLRRVWLSTSGMISLQYQRMKRLSESNNGLRYHTSTLTYRNDIITDIVKVIEELRKVNFKD